MSTKSNQQPKLKLALAEPLQFNGVADAAIMSTLTLSKYINELFFGTFSDYIGCVIKPNTDNTGLCGEAVTVDLYFGLNSDNGRGANYKGFVPVGSAEAESTSDLPSNYLQLSVAHNARVSASTTSVITQEACDLLFDHIGYGVRRRLQCNPKSFKDLGLTVETSMAGQFGMNRQAVYSIIRGVDINSIIKILYGTKTNDYDFMVCPIKPIIAQTDIMNTNNGFMPMSAKDAKWLYSIYKMDKAAIQDLCNEVGIYNKTSDLGICTASFN